MTIREYIGQKMRSFGVTEAQYIDFEIESGVDVDMDYTEEVQEAVGKTLCSLVGELILAPRLSNINENGFSMSWDFTALGKYYLWLCNRWGVTPSKDAVAELGVNMIIDRTSSW